MGLWHGLIIAIFIINFSPVHCRALPPFIHSVMSFKTRMRHFSLPSSRLQLSPLAPPGRTIVVHHFQIELKWKIQEPGTVYHELLLQKLNQDKKPAQKGLWKYNFGMAWPIVNLGISAAWPSLLQGFGVWNKIIGKSSLNHSQVVRKTMFNSLLWLPWPHHLLETHLNSVLLC